MKTQVFSEIGRLRQVLVHTPGLEVEVLVPEVANDLLFEDILFMEKAHQEHDMMCRVFQKYGVETYDILQLLEGALRNGTLWQRHELLKEIQELEHFPEELLHRLEDLPPNELARALIQGVLVDPERRSDERLYELNPIPNIMFARDPIVMLYDRVLTSSMAEKARLREALLLKYTFQNHPTWQTPRPLIDLQTVRSQETYSSSHEQKLTLEGGDLLVLNEDTIAIGLSIRTTLDSIKMLAQEVKKIGVKNVIVAKLPNKISFIHLDTVFTRINHDECLIYPPLFDPKSPTKAQIYHLDLTQDTIHEREYSDIFSLLKVCKMDLKPIFCGGKKDLIYQKREQWTHGANAFCLAPGIMLTYSRNLRTCNELNDAGYLCVSAQEVISPSFTPNTKRKTAILLPGEELCRARGGPRCLTHPLFRDQL